MLHLVNAGAECAPDRETLDTPPSYNESIADTPPQYDELIEKTDTVIQSDHKLTLTVRFDAPSKSECLLAPVGPMTKGDLDWDDTSTFKQTANKKKQKKADQARWADGSGDEGANNGGDGGEENGDGGGDAGGDGGAGGDGAGGDDWNDWDTGKKKKGKKAKEDEKKKEEEEAKKKEEESNPLSWADEDPGDDWGAFAPAASKKDKKDKKKKVSSCALYIYLELISFVLGR